MEFIDKIFYINLDKRQDRRREIETELEKMQFPLDKIERFCAIECGQIGCIESHLSIIRLAKERNYKNILILEDDFQFIVDRLTFDVELGKFFDKGLSFYVLMLAHLCYGSNYFDEQVSVGTNCQDGSGYIVNKSAFDGLIHWLSLASEMLLKTGAHWLYMNDQIWKNMQGEDRWFILNKKMGQQNGSKSDLANTEVSMGVDGKIVIRENVNQTG
jgi:glycosyl transferase family 25